MNLRGCLLDYITTASVGNLLKNVPAVCSLRQSRDKTAASPQFITYATMRNEQAYSDRVQVIWKSTHALTIHFQYSVNTPPSTSPPPKASYPPPAQNLSVGDKSCQIRLKPRGYPCPTQRSTLRKCLEQLLHFPQCVNEQSPETVYSTLTTPTASLDCELVREEVQNPDCCLFAA
ncbi:hypothetical protein ST47_g2533 [Ascochyta rabiei]|uniref:Uncharacterized protein n=1 Tax=Didymella rabiei TaxID=5454 RepID=A0A163JC63_DIDRA|nr:hypothetical protein ST47_g2533 [Ascochyta rabiei]